MEKPRGLVQRGRLLLFLPDLGSAEPRGFGLTLWQVHSNQARARELVYAILRLVSLTLVSLMVWCLLLYTPGSTVIHQGSLADVVVLFVAFALSLAVLIPRLTYILLGLQVFVLFPLFAVTSPTAGSQYSILGVSRPDPGMVLLSAVGLAGLVAFGWKIGFATKKTPSMYAEPLAL